MGLDNADERKPAKDNAQEKGKLSAGEDSSATFMDELMGSDKVPKPPSLMDGQPAANAQPKDTTAQQTPKDTTAQPQPTERKVEAQPQQPVETASNPLPQEPMAPPDATVTNPRVAQDTTQPQQQQTPDVVPQQQVVDATQSQPQQRGYNQDTVLDSGYVQYDQAQQVQDGSDQQAVRTASSPQQTLDNIGKQLDLAGQLLSQGRVKEAEESYFQAIRAADQIDQKAVETERQRVRQEMQRTDLNDEQKRALVQADLMLYSLQRAPDFTRGNLALAYFRSGHTSAGAQMLVEATEHSPRDENGKPVLMSDKNFTNKLAMLDRGGAGGGARPDMAMPQFDGMVEHQIRRGESLSGIASRILQVPPNDARVMPLALEIARANGIQNPDRIYEGNKLMIPHVAGAPLGPEQRLIPMQGQQQQRQEVPQGQQGQPGQPGDIRPQAPPQEQPQGSRPTERVQGQPGSDQQPKQPEPPKFASFDASGKSPLDQAKLASQQFDATVKAAQAEGKTPVLTPELEKQFKDAILASDTGFSPKLEKPLKDYATLTATLQNMLTPEIISKVGTLDKEADGMLQKVTPEDKKLKAIDLYNGIDKAASEEQRQKAIADLQALVPELNPRLKALIDERDAATGPQLRDTLMKHNAMESQLSSLKDEANHAAEARLLYAKALQAAGRGDEAKAVVTEAFGKNGSPERDAELRQVAQSMGVAPDSLKDGATERAQQQQQVTEQEKAKAPDMVVDAVRTFMGGAKDKAGLDAVREKFSNAEKQADTEYQQLLAQGQLLQEAYNKVLPPDKQARITELEKTIETEKANLTKAGKEEAFKALFNKIYDDKTSEADRKAAATQLQTDFPALTNALNERFQIVQPLIKQLAPMEEAIAQNQQALGEAMQTRFLARSYLASSISQAADNTQDEKTKGELKAEAKKKLEEAFTVVPTGARQALSQLEDVKPMMSALGVDLAKIAAPPQDVQQQTGGDQQPQKSEADLQKEAIEVQQLRKQISEATAKGDIDSAIPLYEQLIRKVDGKYKQEESVPAVKMWLDVLESKDGTYNGKPLTDSDRFQIHHAITQDFMAARDRLSLRMEYAQALQLSGRYKSAEAVYEGAIKMADEMPLAEMKRSYTAMVADMSREGMSQGDPNLPAGISRADYLSALSTEINGDARAPFSGMLGMPVSLRTDLAYMELGVKLKKNDDGSIGPVTKTITQNGKKIQVLDYGKSDLFNPDKAVDIVNGAKDKLKEIRGVNLDDPAQVGKYGALKDLAADVAMNKPENLKASINKQSALWNNAVSDVAAAGVGTMVFIGAAALLSRGRAVDEAARMSAKATLARSVVPGMAAVATATGTRAAVHRLMTGEGESLQASFVHGAGSMAAVLAATKGRDAFAKYTTRNVTSEGIVNRLAKENIKTVDQLEGHLMKQGMVGEARALVGFRGKALTELTVAELEKIGLHGAKGVNVVKGTIGNYADDVGLAQRLGEKGVNTVDDLRALAQKDMANLQALGDATKMAKDSAKMSDVLTQGLTGAELDAANAIAVQLEKQGIKRVGDLREALVHPEKFSVLKEFPDLAKLPGNMTLTEAASKSGNVFGAKGSAGRALIEDMAPTAERITELADVQAKMVARAERAAAMKEAIKHPLTTLGKTPGAAMSGLKNARNAVGTKFSEIGQAYTHGAANKPFGLSQLAGAGNAAVEAVPGFVKTGTKAVWNGSGKFLQSQVGDRIIPTAIDIETSTARAMGWKLGQAGYAGALSGGFVYNSTTGMYDNLSYINPKTNQLYTPAEAFLAANYQGPLQNTAVEALVAAPFLRPGPLATRAFAEEAGKGGRAWQALKAVNPISGRNWERWNSAVAKEGMTGLSGLTTMGALNAWNIPVGGYMRLQTKEERARLAKVGPARDIGAQVVPEQQTAPEQPQQQPEAQPQQQPEATPDMTTPPVDTTQQQTTPPVEQPKSGGGTAFDDINNAQPVENAQPKPEQQPKPQAQQPKPQAQQPKPQAQQPVQMNTEPAPPSSDFLPPMDDQPQQPPAKK